MNGKKLVPGENHQYRGKKDPGDEAEPKIIDSFSQGSPFLAGRTDFGATVLAASCAQFDPFPAFGTGPGCLQNCHTPKKRRCGGRIQQKQR